MNKGRVDPATPSGPKSPSPQGALDMSEIPWVAEDFKKAAVQEGSR
jgi:hypothetical protein